MARMRTIKLEFYTDEKICRLSHSERLLFIGMLNFADDNGVGQADPTLLRVAVFPKDKPPDPFTSAIDLEITTNGAFREDSGVTSGVTKSASGVTKSALRTLKSLKKDQEGFSHAPVVTDEMVSQWMIFLAKLQLVRLFRHKDKVLYHVVNWNKHQKIEHPGKFRFPTPESLSRPRDSRENGHATLTAGRSETLTPEDDVIRGRCDLIRGESRGERSAGDTSPAEETSSQGTATTDLDLGRDVIAWMEAVANGQRFRKHWPHKGKASRGPTDNMRDALREKERTIGAENFRQAWVDFLLGDECTARWPYRKFMDTALDRRMEELVDAQVQERHAAEVAQEAEERNLGLPG